jgi:trehalose 6-phosphate synthase
VAREGSSSVRSERPVVVVSNRLPFTFSRTSKGLERSPSQGGLVSALEPVLRTRGGTWVGWPGIEVRNGEQISVPGEPYRITPR